MPLPLAGVDRTYGQGGAYQVNVQERMFPDIAACEGFFGRLKNEMFYNRRWESVTISEFIRQLEEYMVWYRDQRIKMSLGGLSPMEYRKLMGVAA